jgi:hypothetical protein
MQDRSRACFETASSRIVLKEYASPIFQTRAFFAPPEAAFQRLPKKRHAVRLFFIEQVKSSIDCH